MPDDTLLADALDHARRYRASLAERPVGARATAAQLRARFDVPLSEGGEDARSVLRALAVDGDPGLVASAGPRFFGFVIGGSHEVALAADWLTSTWDQNAGLYVASPLTAVLEETAGRWLCQLFELPLDAGVGFVTGTQLANLVGLACARHALLGRQGWDVEAKGLLGAPAMPVVVGNEVHVTVLRALRFLGLGMETAVRVAVDGQGRIRPDALAATLAQLGTPALVCAQAGNVNTGAVDPLLPIAEAVRSHDGWLHVDGAFGLFARVAPSRKYLAEGMERADSWAVDMHKWLNVPYDAGVAIVRDAQVLRATMGSDAAYLVKSAEERDAVNFVPEFSRRGRGIPTYATLRTLGQKGVAELVERCCALARRMAQRLGSAPGVRVLNEVVLNQVLVRFEPSAGGDADVLTRDVVARVQADGTCWLGGSVWQGRAAMRVSVSGWNTTEADIDRSADAILRCARAAGGLSSP
jgi:glutamate/tyrosine decarboxylase-like PLP-dependent enzyme